MANFSIPQLLELQSRIASKAFKCQSLGLVSNVKVTTDISDEDCWSLGVTINSWHPDVHAWEAHKWKYGADKEPHYGEEEMSELEDALDAIIENAKDQASVILSTLNS